MSYVCGECGEIHDDALRYFMWKRPHIPAWTRRRLRYDSQFMCRVPGRRYFISCELEVRFRDRAEEDPLGFIGWAEVTKSTYELYWRFRRASGAQTFRRRMVVGTLANPVPAIPRSLRTRIRFNAVRGDSTPYIRWVSPRTPVAERVREGATDAFWHDAIAYHESAP